MKMEFASMTSLPQIQMAGDKTAVNKEEKCSFKINMAYLPLKVIFFTYMAGQSCGVIFRAIWVKHLGMSTTQNGLIVAVDRVVGIIAPPILGAIHDKCKRPKYVHYFLFITGALLFSSMYFISPENVPASDSNFHQCLTMSCNNVLNNTKSTANSYDFCTQADYIIPLMPEYKSCLKEIKQCLSNASRVSKRNETGNQHPPVLVRSTKTCSLTNVTEFSGVNTTFSFASVKQCICFTLPTAPKEKDEYGCTFWTLSVLILLSSVSMFTGGSIVDTLVLNVMHSKDRHKFGMQRLWGAVGFGLSALLTGYLKDVLEGGKQDPTSNIGFLPVLFGPLLFWAVLCVAIHSLQGVHDLAQANETVKLSGIKEVIVDPRLLALLIFQCMFGYLLGVGELYMFWLAEERFNAASVLLGVSVIMSSAFDVLMYVLSSGLIRKFGPNIIISVGLVLLGIRLLLFTFARHAWQLILADSLRGISFAVMWVSTCQLILQLSPPGLRATTMGLVQAGLWGLGYGTAALFGGVMYERLGADTMFRVSFVMSLIVAMFYVIFFVSHDRWQRSKERKRNNNNDDEVKSLAEEAVCNIDFINQENEETIRNQVENSHV